jgi:hypothetical protein
MRKGERGVIRSDTYVLRNLLPEFGGVPFDTTFLGDGQKAVEDGDVGLESSGYDAADDTAAGT